MVIYHMEIINAQALVNSCKSTSMFLTFIFIITILDINFYSSLN